MQRVLDPISDHLPAPQSIHPSVADNAAVLGDFCPAGHSLVVQLVLTPAIENLPSSQSVQPSVFDVAAFLVEY